jgi:hypothetical protein
MASTADSRGARDGLFVISSVEPQPPMPSNQFLQYYSGLMAWYNPDEEELKIWNGSEWKNANIKNHKGETTNIVIDGKTAKFKNGILTSYK